MKAGKSSKNSFSVRESDPTMRFLKSLKNELFYTGLSEEEFRQVKEPVDARNRRSVIVWSVTAALFWAACFVLYSDPVYARCLVLLRAEIVICMITLASALFLIRRAPRMLYPTMYILELSVLSAGIGLSVLQPDQRISSMMALAVVVPAFFIDRTIASICVEAASVIAYAVLGRNTIDPEVFEWGIKTLIIFSAVGVISGHIMNKSRYERFVYADSAEKLAEIRKRYNEDLKREVAEKTRQIVALHDQLIIGMATMVESRDNSTGGHIRRTSTGVRFLIEAILEDGSLRLTDSFCERIIKAAPMHDLGKIAVDDAILRKPGRFTPEEYEEMKKHASEGARIVNEILIDTDDAEFRAIAENVAHYHHERVDGSGYPDRLKGDEIPLEARIMAIADVYDALVSERVYKESYTFEEADRIILEGMGTQFDPGLRKYYEAARPRLEAYYAEERERT